MTQKYDREKAVEYAYKYGLTPNPEYKYLKIYGEDGGDCSNFVSQCLRAGGIQMVKDNSAPWYYYSDNNHSISWQLSHSLYWCLKIRSNKNLPNGPKALEVYNVKELQLGDIIIYENFKGRINHSAIITGFKDGLPLITQHSKDQINISYNKKNKSKMHFMKIID